MNSLTIPRAFDAHVHLRQDDVLPELVGHSAAYCDALLAMPNTTPPLINGNMVMEYTEKIRRAAEAAGNSNLAVIPCLYLTDNTTADDIEVACVSGVKAAKVYPKGGTTNSDAGITNFRSENFLGALGAMQECDMVLCLHGEAQGAKIDVFEREWMFLDTVRAIHREFPRLRIVLEHISTRAAVECVMRLNDRVAATITAHHIRFNRTDMLGAGLRPLLYCMPVLKHRDEMLAVRRAAVSGNPKFFLGSDSAPHPTDRKISTCCAAGAFTAPTLLPMLVDTFEQTGLLKQLGAFASEFGPHFYGFSPSTRTITLVREPMVVSDMYGRFPALMGGETLPWSLAK